MIRRLAALCLFLVASPGYGAELFASSSGKDYTVATEMERLRWANVVVARVSVPGKRKLAPSEIMECLDEMLSVRQGGRHLGSEVLAPNDLAKLSTLCAVALLSQ